MGFRGPRVQIPPSRLENCPGKCRGFFFFGPPGFSQRRSPLARGLRSNPAVHPQDGRPGNQPFRTLPLLRRRAILGHRGLHERLERACGDLLPFVDVDRPSRVAFQAGIEEARWVWDPGPPGERKLHDLRVRLPRCRQSRGATRPDCSTSTPRSSRGRLPGSAPASGRGSPRAIPPARGSGGR